MSDVMVEPTVNHGSTVETRMPRYGMVIDLKRCYGCYACVMACKTANHTPPNVFWARLLKGEVGKFPNVVRQSLPVLCMQCEEPSCLEVCPTGATIKTEDGIVTVDKDKCMGCKACMMACPYGARYSVDEWESYFPDGLPLSPYEEFTKKAWEEKSGVGVATKCDQDVPWRGAQPGVRQQTQGVLPAAEVGRSSHPRISNRTPRSSETQHESGCQWPAAG